MTGHATGSPVKNTKPDCPEYVIVDNLSQARKTDFSLFSSQYFASNILNGQEPTNALVRTSFLILYRTEVWFWLDIRENALQKMDGRKSTFVMLKERRLQVTATHKNLAAALYWIAPNVHVLGSMVASYADILWVSAHVPTLYSPLPSPQNDSRGGKTSRELPYN